MCSKHVDDMSNSVDPDQMTSVGLHYFLRRICPCLWKLYIAGNSGLKVFDVLNLG